MGGGTNKSKNIPRRYAPPPSKGDLCGAQIHNEGLCFQGVSKMPRFGSPKNLSIRGSVPAFRDVTYGRLRERRREGSHPRLHADASSRLNREILRSANAVLLVI
jgi:hypothetical protein